MKAILRLASIVFTASALTTVALLMGSHTPYRTDLAAPGMAERATGHWHAAYILGAGCACSQRVAKHLASRRKALGLREEVILVGEDPATERELRTHGWLPERWPAARVRSIYGAISAPLVVFVDGEGKIRYSGGLSRRTDSGDGFHEEEIWAALSLRETPARLPAFGCALRF